MRGMRPVSEGVRSVGGGLARVLAGLRYGFREYRRNTVLWVLLAVVPVVFITLAVAVTPDGPAPLQLDEHGRRFVAVLSMVDLHGAVMAPIAVAFLAGLAGLFVALGSSEADRRLALAGFRSWEVLTARLGVIAFAVTLITAISLAVTAVDFRPHQWLPFAGANLLVAFTYALIGVVVGPLAGRIGGLYLMFLLPFVDVGLAQNPMFAAAPPGWAPLGPGYGAVRLLLDGAFTSGFDAAGGLVAALGWLAALTIAVVVVFRRTAEPERA